MKQLNVRDATHQLCKSLSARTGKSVIVLVQEALELYREGYKELGTTESLVNKFLREVGISLEGAIIDTATIEIPKVVKQAIEKIYAERAAIDEQLAKLAAEAAKDVDDLEVVDHDEFYGTLGSATQEIEH